MKKVGIGALSDRLGGGVFQYAISLIEALDVSSNTNPPGITYVIFTYNTQTVFDHLPVEIRKLTPRKQNIMLGLIRLFCLIFNIRSPLFFSEDESNLFSDIDLFISPPVVAYPHFYLNKPFVVTLHDMQERYFPGFFNLKDRLARRILNRALSRNAELILCESDFVKADINRFLNVGMESIYVLPAPPANRFLSFSADAKRQDEVTRKYKLPREYLFYPAQFWPHKNHLKLLEAVSLVRKKFPNLSLVLVGAKQSNYQLVRDRISQLSLVDVVSYLGYIDIEDLPYVYKMAKMLVMPSLFESISIPVYEAFLLKVPVCASNVTAIPQQVGTAGVLFDPNDAVEMANKIELVLTNTVLAQSIVESGSQVISKFTHNQFSSGLKNAIEIVLKRI